ncbi:MAG: hypothetical protein FJ271_17665 [Planctomycetes bacterium]|nr:hypothetical protein [Planctomycetota bacterium]
MSTQSAPGMFPTPYPGNDLSRPQGSNAPAPTGQGLSSLLGPTGNSPSAQGNGKNDPGQRDWRSSWGKPPAGPTPAPGQSVVEPTPPGKGPLFTGMQKDKSGPPPGLFSTMPPTSMVQNSKQPDPLLTPERYGTPKVDRTLGDRPVMEGPRYRDVPPAAGPSQPTPTQAPVGIQSVISANNGVDMPLRFVPVPIVTVPQPMRPPGPPKPEVPQAPSPAGWTNAFAPVRQPANAPPTPAAAPAASQSAPPTAYMPGSYGMPMDPRTQMPNPPMPNLQMPGMQMPGTQMANMQAARSPYGPAPYGPNPYANPAMVANVGPRPPQMGGAVGSGQWPWDNDAAPPLSAYKSQRPVARINYPQTYAGPMAPNPAGNLNAQGMMPPMNPGAMHPYAQAGHAQMPVPAPMMPPLATLPPRPELGAMSLPPGMGIDPASVHQWLGVLLESPYPAQREWAAMNLSAVDLQASPDVLQALLTVARKDPAATVRASCVTCLARQNLTSQPVLTTLHSLVSDPDPRVRTEAEQSLIRLTGSHSTPTARPIQPVDARQ